MAVTQLATIDHGDRKMRGHIGRICTAILATCAVGLTVQAVAQDKYSFSISSEGAKGRYVQQTVIDVDDVSGHQVRVFEVQHIYPANHRPTIDGDAIVEQWTRGTSSYTDGVGPNSGFMTWITEKGEKVFLEFNGVAESKATASGSKRGTAHGTRKIVGGTGRFSKMRGTGSEVTEFDTDPKDGYNRGTMKGEYWFAQ
jgi:hypothetical protein